MLSAKVTSVTSRSCARLGLGLLLLFHVIVIARPPRSRLLRGARLVEGELCRWTPIGVPGRYDLRLEFLHLFSMQ
jgi:hypothetical protein